MPTMGFEKDSQRVIEQPLVPISFTNAICYGKTGSGKTSGYILPNIENRIKQNHGILVYDFKGNLHVQVKMIAQKHGKLEDVVEIGKPWGEKINIVQKLDSRTIRDVFVNMHGGSADPFWQNAAANLFSAIFKIQINFQKIAKLEKTAKEQDIDIERTSFGLIDKEVSLRSIFNVIKSLQDLKEFFNSVSMDQKYTQKNIKNILAQNGDKRVALYLANHLEKIEKSLDEIEAYKKLDPDKKGDMTGGLYSVLDVASSIISNAGTNEYINDNLFDMTDSLREGKIVVVNLRGLDDTILGILNLSIYRALQKNLNKKHNHPVSIFIDEAQKVLHPNYLPDVDVCRESEFEYIFATQDRLLLDTTLGPMRTESLLRNIVVQYSFATNDPVNNTEGLKQFEYRNLLTHKNRFSDPIFFESEELFNIEHKYQVHHDITRFVDFRDIKEKKIDEKFILLNSPELVDKNEIYIKTEKSDFFVASMGNIDTSILDIYFHQIAQDGADLDIGEAVKMIDKKYSIFRKTTKPKDVKKYVNCDTPSVEDEIWALDVLGNKNTSRVKSMESSLQSHSTSISICHGKLDVLETKLKETFGLDFEKINYNYPSKPQNDKNGKPSMEQKESNSKDINSKIKELQFIYKKHTEKLDESDSILDNCRTKTISCIKRVERLEAIVKEAKL